MKNALKWVSGILILLCIIPAFTVSQSFLSAICFFVSGIVCIPATLKDLENRIGAQILTPYKYAMVIGFWLLGTVVFKSPNIKSEAQATIPQSMPQNNIISTHESTDTSANSISLWSYDMEENKMAEKSFYASVTANNTLYFDFPYNGGASCELTLRYKGGENNVYMKVSKGQFMPNVLDDRRIRVKFDDEKPITFGYSMPSDASSNLIFINSERKFIDKLKKSKKVVIEAEFFNEGLRQLEYTTSGLKWDR